MVGRGGRGGEKSTYDAFYGVCNDSGFGRKALWTWGREYGYWRLWKLEEGLALYLH